MELRVIRRQAPAARNSNTTASNASSSNNISLANIPGNLMREPAALQQYIQSHPNLLQQLLVQNPRMAEAVLADSPVMLTEMLREQQQRKREAEAKRRQQIALLNADPFDMEAQAKVSWILTPLSRM